MSWFNRVRNSLGFGEEKKSTEKDLWIKCSNCHEMLFVAEYEENDRVCPRCDHHGRIGAMSGSGCCSTMGLRCCRSRK